MITEEVSLALDESVIETDQRYRIAAKQQRKIDGLEAAVVTVMYMLRIKRKTMLLSHTLHQSQLILLGNV